MAVSRNRRMLLRTLQDFQKDGSLPKLAHQPKLARGVRGGAFFAPKSTDWLEAYKKELDQAPLEQRIAHPLAAE
jgi:hypothetical protein